MDINNELNNINELLINKKRELDKVQEEYDELLKKQYKIKYEINKNNCLEYLSLFINKHGNILNQKLHNELRRALSKILYKDKTSISSSEQVLRFMLDVLSIKYEYLKEKDENDTNWSLIKIYLK